MEKNPKVCGGCGSTDSPFRCQCKHAYYCGAECQRKSWPEHRASCANFLYKEIQRVNRNGGGESLAAAEMHLDLGGVYRCHGELAEAQSSWCEALRLFKLNLGERNPAVLRVSVNIAVLYKDLGRYQDSLEALKDALKLCRRPNVGSQHDLGVIYNNMASSLHAQGHVQQALKYANRALYTWRDCVGDKHLDVAMALCNAGDMHLELGDDMKALEMFEEALAIHREPGNDADQYTWPVAYTLSSLGHLHFKAADFDRALELYTESLQLRRLTHGENHPCVADSIVHASNVHYMQGGFDRCMALRSKAMKIRCRSLGPGHRDVAWVRHMIGKVHLARDELPMALEENRIALESMRALADACESDIAAIEADIAVCKFLLRVKD